MRALSNRKKVLEVLNKIINILLILRDEADINSLMLNLVEQVNFTFFVFPSKLIEFHIEAQVKEILKSFFVIDSG